MNAIPAEIWHQLEPIRPKGDELVGRPAMSDVTPRLLAAIDSAGHRHLLVLLEVGDAELCDLNSRGISAQTQELILPGQEHARYINLKCNDSAGHVMFDVIGGEIGERLRARSGSPSEIVALVMARWRRFWGLQAKKLLSYEQQIGLFTELWFLAYWLMPVIGPLDAVRRWRGPHGARHDFEHPRLSVEAKGTSSARGRIFHINGLQQLDPPEQGPLLLFGMRLREEAGATNSIPVLADACRQLVRGGGEAEDLFETALIKAGYADSDRTEYGILRCRVVEEVLFEVRDNFPRITRDVISGGLPVGVEEIEYSINLSGFDHLIVARKPADAPDILRA